MNDYTANKISYDREAKKFVEFGAEAQPKTPKSVLNSFTAAPGEFKDAIYGNLDYKYAPNYAVQDPSVPAHKNQTTGYWD
jgi:hypothetical protein